MSIENLIAEITREVISEISSEKTSQGAKTILLLFMQVDIDIDGVLKQLEHLKGKNHLKAIFPKWAQNLYGKDYWSSMDIDVRYLNYENMEQKDTILSADELIIFSPTDGFLSKISRMSKDTLPSYMVMQAIALNKKVSIIQEYIKDSSAEKFKTKINNIGIEINSIKNLDTIVSRSFVKSSASPVVSSGHCGSSGSKGCVSCNCCVSKKTPDVKRIIEAGASRIGATVGVDVPTNLAPYIDHTLLKSEAAEKDVIKLCEEAKKYVFASVCVNPSYVPLCAKMLAGTKVKVCTVIGFPLGATTTETKAFEAMTAVENGAGEIDMVINVGALKSKNYDKVEKDIREVVRACKGKTCKVILETALLNQEEKIIACQLSKSAGADFVKTSTGFGPGGATEADIALMRKVVGKEMGVKASGGVKDYEIAVKMIKAGASRVGASASVAIMNKQKSDSNY